MTNRRYVLAVGLAAASIATATILGLMITSLIAGVPIVPAGPALGISTIILAGVAFVLSWKQRSFLVSGLLIAAGIAGMTPGLFALARINFAVIEFPGPILGFVIGLAIIGLGVAMGIRTAKIEPATAR